MALDAGIARTLLLRELGRSNSECELCRMQAGPRADQGSRPADALTNPCLQATMWICCET